MKCPKHPFTTMVITGWMPHPGLDKKLRQFKCPRCHRVEYKIPRGFENRQEVKV